MSTMRVSDVYLTGRNVLQSLPRDAIIGVPKTDGFVLVPLPACRIVQLVMNEAEGQFSTSYRNDGDPITHAWAAVTDDGRVFAGEGFDADNRCHVEHLRCPDRVERVAIAGSGEIVALAAGGTRLWKWRIEMPPFDPERMMYRRVASSTPRKLVVDQDAQMIDISATIDLSADPIVTIDVPRGFDSYNAREQAQITAVTRGGRVLKGVQDQKEVKDVDELRDYQIVLFAEGRDHRIWVDPEGALYFAESNEVREITNDEFDPPMEDGDEIVEIGAGRNHMAVRTAQGRVYTWGYDKWSKLGYCEYESDTGVFVEEPRLLSLMPGPAARVYVSTAATTFLLRDGHLVAAGYGGELLDPLNSHNRLRHVTVPVEHPLPADDLHASRITAFAGGIIDSTTFMIVVDRDPHLWTLDQHNRCSPEHRARIRACLILHIVGDTVSGAAAGWSTLPNEILFEVFRYTCVV